MIFHAPMDTEGRRGLLVFVSGEEAAEFARGTGMKFLKPTPVAPEAIERVCNAHGFALAGVWTLEGGGRSKRLHLRGAPRGFRDDGVMRPLFKIMRIVGHEV